MQHFESKNHRSELASMLVDPERKQFEGEKCWQCVATDDFGDLCAHLRYLKVKILLYFGVEEIEHNECTHLLARTSQGHEFIIKINNYKYDGKMIPLMGAPMKLIPEKVRQHFESKLQSAPTSYCFVTHNGLETLGNEEMSYTNVKQEYGAPKLQRGTHFYACLPYVGHEKLASVHEANDLYTFVSESNSTRQFHEMVCRSGAKNLLTAKGPFTLFAPSDFALNECVGVTCASDFTVEQCRDVVLNHVVPGSYGSDFSGEVRNLAGNTLQMKNGLVTDAGKELNWDFDVLQKANGQVGLMNHVFRMPSKEKMMQMESNRSISDSTIATTTYYIYKAQNLLDKKEMQFLKDQLQILSTRLEKHEQEVVNLDKTGKQLLELDAQYREHLHLASVEKDQDDATIVSSSRKSELEGLSERIAHLSGQYAKHVNSGSQLVAMSTVIMPLIKSARDA